MLKRKSHLLTALVFFGLGCLATWHFTSGHGPLAVSTAQAGSACVGATYFTQLVSAGPYKGYCQYHIQFNKPIFMVQPTGDRKYTFLFE